MIIRIIKMALAFLFVSTLFLPYSTENFQIKMSYCQATEEGIFISFVDFWAVITGSVIGEALHICYGLNTQFSLAGLLASG